MTENPSTKNLRELAKVQKEVERHFDKDDMQVTTNFLSKARKLVREVSKIDVPRKINPKRQAVLRKNFVELEKYLAVNVPDGDEERQRIVGLHVHAPPIETDRVYRSLEIISYNKDHVFRNFPEHHGIWSALGPDGTISDLGPIDLKIARIGTSSIGSNGKHMTLTLRDMNGLTYATLNGQDKMRIGATLVHLKDHAQGPAAKEFRLNLFRKERKGGRKMQKKISTAISRWEKLARAYLSDPSRGFGVKNAGQPRRIPIETFVGLVKECYQGQKDEKSVSVSQMRSKILELASNSKPGVTHERSMRRYMKALRKCVKFRKPNNRSTSRTEAVGSVRRVAQTAATFRYLRTLSYNTDPANIWNYDVTTFKYNIWKDEWQIVCVNPKTPRDATVTSEALKPGSKSGLAIFFKMHTMASAEGDVQFVIEVPLSGQSRLPDRDFVKLELKNFAPGVNTHIYFRNRNASADLWAREIFKWQEQVIFTSRKLAFPEWFEEHGISNPSDLSEALSVPLEMKAELIFDGEQGYLSHILKTETIQRNVSNRIHTIKLHAAATSKEQPLDAKEALFKVLKGRFRWLRRISDSDVVPLPRHLQRQMNPKKILSVLKSGGRKESLPDGKVKKVCTFLGRLRECISDIRNIRVTTSMWITTGLYDNSCSPTVNIRTILQTSGTYRKMSTDAQKNTQKAVSVLVERLRTSGFITEADHDDANLPHDKNPSSRIPRSERSNWSQHRCECYTIPHFVSMRKKREEEKAALVGEKLAKKKAAQKDRLKKARKRADKSIGRSRKKNSKIRRKALKKKRSLKDEGKSRYPKRKKR